MINHPHRSRHMRTVAFKIQEGGGLAAASEYSTSDLTIKVTAVPQSVTTADVLIKLRKISLLRKSAEGHWTIMGPFSVPWERVEAAKDGAILRV